MQFAAPFPVECTRKQCANCGENHSSSDRDCPRYKQTKDILKIKTIEKCSMGEARRKYNEKQTHTQTPQISYSNVTKSTNNKPNTTTLNTSTATTYKRPASPTKANITKIAKTQTHTNKPTTDNNSTTKKPSTQITHLTNENENSSNKNYQQPTPLSKTHSPTLVKRQSSRKPTPQHLRSVKSHKNY